MISRRGLLVGTGALLAAPLVARASSLMQLRGDIYVPQTIDWLLQRLSPSEFGLAYGAISGNFPKYWAENLDGKVYVWPLLPPNVEIVAHNQGLAKVLAVRETRLVRRQQASNGAPSEPEHSADPMQMTREDLHRLAQRTRDPRSLPSEVLDRMERLKVGPFMHDWEYLL